MRTAMNIMLTLLLMATLVVTPTLTEYSHADIAPQTISGPELPITLDTSDDYTTTADWDSGTKTNTTSITDRFNQSSNTLELDFPYAEKDTNLISYWRMENLTDETGTLNLINSGGADVNPNGKFGSCYNFNDGDTEYMTISDAGDNYDFGINEGFTIVIWLKVLNNGNYQRVISKYDDIDGYELVISNVGLPYFAMKSSAGTYYTVTLPNVIWGDSTFHMIAARRVASSNVIKIWLDDGTDTASLSATAGSLANAAVVQIGRYKTGTGYYDGDMDEPKIYSTELSDATLLEMYNSGNQYPATGNWASPYINLTDTTEKLNNITYDFDFADSNNCVDNTTIMYTSNSTVIGWDATDITTDSVLTWSDFTPTEAFNITEGQNITIQTFLKGNNSATPTLTILNYTTNAASDTTLPELANATETPDPQDYGGYVNITADITDDTALYGAWANISYPNGTVKGNYSMTAGTGDEYYYNTTYSYAGWYNYTIWANDTADNWNSTTGSFNISDAVTITFISQTPDNVNISTTGNISILYNITTHNTPINASSIIFAHSVNHTDDNTRNSSFHIPIDANQPDGLRAYGRGISEWYEMFNATGTGELGYIGEWMAMTTNDTQLSVQASGSNWTVINFTAKTPHLFSSVWYVDKASLTAEVKTGQYIEIYGKHSVRNWFNMSFTEAPEKHKFNNLMRIGFYAEPVGTPKPLVVYLANESYVSGNPATSPYAVPIGQILYTDDYAHTTANSSYHSLTFSTNDTGYIGGLYLDDNSTFIYVGGNSPVNIWRIYWADDNVSIGSQYHNLNNTWFQYTTLNSWTSWAWRNGTIDCHLHFFDLEGNDTIEYKLYAEDVWMSTGDGTWSITNTDIVNETDLPPNSPLVLSPNGTAPTDAYEIGETINITYEWVGDPNHNDQFWSNITCHNSTTGAIIYWVQNRSINHTEISHNGDHWYYEWTPILTLPFDTGYYINVTITDDTNLSSYDVQNGTFTYQDSFAPELIWLKIDNITLVSGDEALFYGQYTHNITARWSDYLFSSSWINITVPNGTYLNYSMAEYTVNATITDAINIIDYTTLGTYVITIWANDTTNNWNSSFSFNLTIRLPADAGGGGGSPIDDRYVDFTFTIEGRIVQFNYSGTIGRTYEWAFGDNRGSNQTNPLHLYNAYTKDDKPYLVTLWVTFPDGTVMKVEKEIYLANPTLDIYSGNIQVGMFVWSGFGIMLSAFIMYIMHVYGVYIIVPKKYAPKFIPAWFIFGVFTTFGFLEEIWVYAQEAGVI